MGAGLIRGVDVYVTVLVTISLTSRTLFVVVRGDLMSKYLPLLAESQSYGERALLALRALNGERTAEEAVNGALNGDSDPENDGEGGIRRRPSHDVERADDGYVKEAEVGKAGATDVVGDL